MYELDLASPSLEFLMRSFKFEQEPLLQPTKHLASHSLLIVIDRVSLLERNPVDGHREFFNRNRASDGISSFSENIPKSLQYYSEIKNCL
jgi:hypothetical protein